MSAIDAARPLRAGEELPLDRLVPWLAEHVPALGTLVEVRQFPGGWSNLTYLLQGADGEAVLRRAPPGAAVRGGHDMAREHRVLSRLGAVWPKVPRPLALCLDPDILGAPFYVAERVRGLIVRGPLPADLAGVAGPLSLALADTLAELHAVDVEGAGLSDLGRGAGYVARQVEGWAARWARARTADVPDLADVAAWLLAHQPPEALPAVVHNDFKHDNVVLDPDDPARIVAVLDWEMATVGDPLLDLGTTLAYWPDPADPAPWRAAALCGAPLAPGSLDRRGVAARWAERTGRSLDALPFAYTFGLFKVATIGQQIYARFRAGEARDPRFAALGAVVAAAGDMARRALAAGRIHEIG